ncbi:MAG: type III-B CRISPR module-associated protein Cmr5 [Streptosporangiaceae bacterium]
MTARRIDQNMATAAAAALPSASGLGDAEKKALRTTYRRLGAMLHNAGLAATYAFVAARSNAETGVLAQAYQEAARGIRNRLSEVGLLSGDMGPRQVLESLGTMDPVQYARAGAEAAALTRWLSRLADATYQVARSADDAQLERAR